jgi:lipoyl(octanoyl) transferase
MAIDEAIFRQAQRTAMMPTLRCYGWSNPTVSLGYFQHVEREIDLTVCRKEGIDIVGRPTGGKAVYHDDDLTYAVVAGEKDAFFPTDIIGTYRVISQCIAAGLCQFGIKVELADRRCEGGPACLKTSCFSVPSHFELLVQNKKICGSAQVRSRGFFLQHGSLLMTFDPAKTYEVMLPHMEPKEDHVRRLRESITSMSDHLTLDDGMHWKICSALKQAFAEHFNATFREGELTAAEESLKSRLLQTKYRRENWNREGIL